jgi:hypothetical protein
MAKQLPDVSPVGRRRGAFEGRALSSWLLRAF